MKNVINRNQVFGVALEVNGFLEETDSELISLLNGLEITTKDFEVFSVNKRFSKIRKVIHKNAEDMLLDTII